MAFVPNQKLPASQLNDSFSAKANQSDLLTVSASAAAALQGVNTIANGTAPSAGALAGSDVFTISRGAGALRTTLTAIGQWVLQTFQGFTQNGSGATARTASSKLAETVSVLDFGADPTGVADSTASCNAAIATGRSVYFPAGTYRITAPLTFAVDGQVLYGDGKDNQSIITNTTNASQLFASSVGTGAAYRRRCGIHRLSFVGNALTTLGVEFRGLSDGLTGDADKSSWMRDVRITGVGAGYGMRVNSWSNNFENVEIWSNFKGLQVDTGANSCMFSGMYVTGCTAEALQMLGSAASNVFDNCVFQYSGGTNYMLDLQGGLNTTFTGTYLENSNAPTAVVGVSNAAKGINFIGTFHNLVGGTANVPIITSNVKAVQVQGIVNAGGTMASFLQLTGTLPYGMLSNYFVVAGAVTTPMDDQSTRKLGIVLDGQGSRFGPNVVRSLASENGTEWRRSDTDAVLAFMQNGSLYLGPDVTTGVALNRSGSSLSVTNNGAAAAARVSSVLLGATGSVRLQFGSGSPNSVATADAGSLYVNTAGGANTTLWVKETGSGNTGWVAK